MTDNLFEKDNLEAGINGFIKIPRNIINQSWYNSSEHFHLFFHLVLNATHKDNFHQGTEIKRGQVKTGRLSLAKSTGIAEHTVERILTFFEGKNLIVQQKTNKYRLITIVNYEDFNGTAQQSTTDNSNSTASQQQKTQTRMDDNVENEKNNRNKKFTPPSYEDVEKYCIERKNGINPQGFLDYYDSQGWMRGKTKIKDWKACIRTWEQRNKPVETSKPKVIKEDPPIDWGLMIGKEE